MRALVTGVAGFIGSHLAERLVTDGWDVTGVDRSIHHDDEPARRDNLAGLVGHRRFTLIEADLLTAEPRHLVDGADVVFHHAAQPGVRSSWAGGFGMYNALNVGVTQRLLEAVRRGPLHRFVFASSSSVYGNAAHFPVTEDAPAQPFSPYGITKLAAELLCRAYTANFSVPTVSLRYFTVYGPRQRPDMAIHRMIEAARGGSRFPLYGDGTQVRDFTYVGDVVEATVRAATAEVEPGTVLNVAGGSGVQLSDLLDGVQRAVGRPVPVDRLAAQPGDVARTGGSIARAAELLGWSPTVDLAAGLAAQAAWHRPALPAS
jgi:UDP-glucuronate 4-epimerase